MKKWIGKKYLDYKGWTIGNGFPKGIKNSIIVGAPHTSNMDFYIGLSVLFYLQMRVRFLIKSELFWPPLGNILSAIGGIPVERGKSQQLTRRIRRMIESEDTLHILFTPEGTRSRVDRWKTGFYRVAKGAEIPMVLGYLDYGNKEAGFGPVMHPSGDYEKDLAKIREFYQDVTPCHSECFNPNFN